MKRAEIKLKIKEIFDKVPYFLYPTDELTDLFIQLSEERCQEQREKCSEYLSFNIGYDHETHKEIILNAPLPTLD